MWTGQTETRERVRPPTAELVAAFVAGAATEGDVVDHLVGDRPRTSWLAAFTSLHDLTRKAAREELDDRLGEIVDRVRARVIEIELRRGEAPTAASRPALALRDSGGLDVLMRLMAALGSAGFVRGWSYDGGARPVVFSRLIRVTSPGEGDTPEAFASAVAAAGITEKRLIELGMFAPQWARHVERAVGWPSIASAIWWFHAHTKDTSWTVDRDVSAVWAAEVSEQTVTLNTSDASLGNAFNQNQVKELPLDGRNVPDLLSLQPGVSYTNNREDVPGWDTRNGAVNGARSDQSNVTVDGVASVGLARLNANGTVDTGFVSSAGILDDSVWRIGQCIAGFQGCAEGR
jgi:hypothetical protein